MPKSLIDVWIRRDALRKAHLLAGESYPFETGGLLMGYWASATECVVRHISGPGPHASHYSSRYVPDYAYDEKVALKQHASTSGADVYLGDWHSHPNSTTPYLSRRDRKSLRNVAVSEIARAPRPLSMVCAGRNSEWTHKIWVGEMGKYWFGVDFLTVLSASVHAYE